MAIISVVLFSEYRYFRKQSEMLIELQDDYRTYVTAVNKILRDYNRMKEKLDETGTEEKKKEIDKASFFFDTAFPDDAIVFSSDAVDYDVDTFVTINRDNEYLEESAVKFIKRHEDGVYILENMNLSDWVEYTDYLLSKLSIEKQKTVPKKSSTESKISSFIPVNQSKPKNRTKKIKLKDIRLSWPIEKDRFWISSLYGPRKKKNGSWGFHYGTDMAALKGTPVLAAYTGIVIEARYSKSYGYTILLAHSRKYRTRYAHLSKILVKIGDKIKRGAIIGKVGDTGFVRRYPGRDASHLHFELLEFGKKINPMPFMS